MFNPIGSLGSVVFQVNPIQTQTYRDMTINFSAAWADHAVAGNKAISEFISPELYSGTLTIDLSASLGIDPLSELNKLITIVESGEPQTLVLGYENKGKMTLREISCRTTQVNGLGVTISMEVDIAFVEYIDAMPTQAKNKQQQDVIQRSQTGKGGPQRLPGIGPPTKQRTVTTIDPVTRMEK